MDRPLTTAERAARGNHPDAVPDYAALATAEIERRSGKPRRTWGAYAPEHQEVTALLKQWAKERGADVDAERAESRQRMSSGRMRTVYAERECERCGREFTPRGPAGRYCHKRDCAQVAEKKARAA